MMLFGRGKPQPPADAPLNGNKRTGQQGEEIAAGFLTTRGYHILERNFRCKGGEVDIIARDPGDRAWSSSKSRPAADWPTVSRNWR